MASLIGSGRPRAGRRRLAAVTRLSLAAIVAASAVFGAVGTVAAASQSKDLAQTFTGGAATNLSMEGFAPCDECVPDWLFPNTPGAIALGVSVKAAITHVDYTSDATTSVAFNDSELRQGATLHTTDVFTPTNGKVELKGNISGDAGFYNSPNFDPLGPWFGFETIEPISIPFDETLDCPLTLTGDGTRTCDVTLASLPALSLPVLYPLFIDLSCGSSSGTPTTSRRTLAWSRRSWKPAGMARRDVAMASMRPGWTSSGSRRPRSRWWPGRPSRPSRSVSGRRLSPGRPRLAGPQRTAFPAGSRRPGSGDRSSARCTRT